MIFVSSLGFIYEFPTDLWLQGKTSSHLQLLAMASRELHCLPATTLAHAAHALPHPCVHALSSLTARRSDIDTALSCVDGCPHLQDQHYLGNMQNFAPSVKIPALPALSSEQKTLSPITPELKIVF
jgi:hypothetical protein